MTSDLIYEVVVALAAAEGVDPQELEYTLSEHVDTDVLAALGRSEESVWEFTFRVPSHTVTVTHDGRIYVDDIAYRGGVRIEEPSHS
jgi:hypothetical protein